VARAIELGRDRGAFARIREKLVTGRDTCLLFDTPSLVRDLEALYGQMWEEFRQGKLPVPDLRNLDIYHEIAQDFEFEKTELLTDEAYHSLYRQKLANWHATYPIGRDSRLWQEGA
jgi:hypothetical protein